MLKRRRRWRHMHFDRGDELVSRLLSLPCTSPVVHILTYLHPQSKTLYLNQDGVCTDDCGESYYKDGARDCRIVYPSPRLTLPVVTPQTRPRPASLAPILKPLHALLPLPLVGELSLPSRLAERRRALSRSAC